MTIKELKIALPKLVDQERVAPLTALMKVLSPVSEKELRDFQNTWNPADGYEKFVEGQNEIILRCIDMEVSEFGTIAREALDLEPLTLEHELV